MQRVTDWPLRVQSLTLCGRDRRVAGSPGRGRQEHLRTTDAPHTIGLLSGSAWFGCAVGRLTLLRDIVWSPSAGIVVVDVDVDVDVDVARLPARGPLVQAAGWRP